MFIVVSLLVIALIAAALGFSGLAGTAVGVAKLVFITAIILPQSRSSWRDCAGALAVASPNVR